MRRSDGLTGHLNRAVGEVSGVVHIAGPGAEFDVEQADGIVLGHDRSLSTLTVVDPRTFQIVNDVAVPVDAHVAAVTGGAIVWQPAPLRVWSLDVAALTSTTSIDEVAPIVSTEGSGSALVTFDEDLVVLDVERQQLLRYPVRQGLASGGEGSSITPLGGLAERITSMTTVGDDGRGDDRRRGVVFEVGDADAAATAAASPVEVGRARPGRARPAGTRRVADRRCAARRLGRADRPRRQRSSPAPTGAVVDLAAIGAGGPLAPIVHQGCVFTVGTEPPTFTRICHGVADQTVALTGADPGRCGCGWSTAGCGSTT